MASVTGSVIRVDEEELRGHLDDMVRASLDETLHTMLDAGGGPAVPGRALRTISGPHRHLAQPV
jgi:hypothetical protein